MGGSQITEHVKLSTENPRPARSQTMAFLLRDNGANQCSKYKQIRIVQQCMTKCAWLCPTTAQLYLTPEEETTIP